MRTRRDCAALELLIKNTDAPSIEPITAGTSALESTKGRWNARLGRIVHHSNLKSVSIKPISFTFCRQSTSLFVTSGTRSAKIRTLMPKTGYIYISKEPEDHEERKWATHGSSRLRLRPLQPSVGLAATRPTSRKANAAAPMLHKHDQKRRWPSFFYPILRGSFAAHLKTRHMSERAVPKVEKVSAFR